MANQATWEQIQQGIYEGAWGEGSWNRPNPVSGITPGASSSPSSSSSSSPSSSPSSSSSSSSSSSLSSSESAALREFVAANGRQPTASEVSAWRAAHGGTSSGSAAASASAATESGTKITTNTDLSLDAVTPWETPEIASLENQKKEYAASDSLLGSAESILEDLRKRNESWLKGEISADVAEGLRSKAALAARSGGAAGSQASRNLQARDFGVTSMQLQESGMQREAQLAELSKGLGSIREQRAQYFANLQETSKQFGANLADQMTRTQLAHRELMFKQDAFNAEQNARIVELISESTLGMMQLQVSAASADVDFGGNLSTWEKLQSQLSGLLSRSNAATK